MKRKLLISLITSIISVPIVAYFFNDFIFPAHFGLLGFVSLWVVPIILIYGIPVSFISDKVTQKKLGSKRMFYSLTIHLFLGTLFAYLFILIFDNRFIPSMAHPVDRTLLLGSMVTAFVFWGVTEYLRLKSYK
ncbi:hypothetical protein ACTWQB_02910 [Piscibacillus sp. B03]|uniref:hypothetical protein n=1 Tax=Piscibacillus sp. B03 TaxID=3457430 RepID=UPI003FCCB579